MAKLLYFNLFGRGRSLRWAITITCQIAFVLFGYDQGVFSGIVGNENFRNQFGYPGSAEEGIIVSVYNLGAFPGCVINFFTGEKMGCRLAIYVAMIWIIVGAILQTTAYSVPQMIIARYITGIGTGIETSTVPMYQSELCDADKRGRLVSSEPLFVGVGIVIAYFFDYGMSFTPGSVAWRVPIACQVIFAFMTMAMVHGVPESPRWLYARNRNEAAMKVMCDVWDSDQDGEKVQKMQNDILGALEMERKHGEYRWRDILKRDDVQTGRRVLLAYGMQFMNQMGGINLVVYYVPKALEANVGLTRNLALLIGGAVQCMFFVGSLVPTFFLDRMGRRRPMMWGSLGLAISMMMISILLSFQREPWADTPLALRTSEASVAFFFIYMLFFGATANCIPWVYVPEILPLHARAKGTAIGISSNWLWNFFVVMISPTLLGRLQWAGYLIFVATNFLFIPLVYFCYPETSNLTLEEVDLLFTKNGADGLKKLMRRSQPVQESMRPADELDRELEKRIGGMVQDDEKGEHVDRVDDKAS